MNLTIIGNDGFEHVFDDKPELGISAVFFLMEYYYMTQLTLPNHIKDIEVAINTTTK